MRLHYHAIFSIVTIVDWSRFINDQSHQTKDFLNQQAMFTAMKSRAHFLISNLRISKQSQATCRYQDEEKLFACVHWRKKSHQTTSTA